MQNNRVNVIFYITFVTNLAQELQHTTEKGENVFIKCNTTLNNLKHVFG